jgi:ferredoxin--NADP+ reductase
LYPRQAGAPLPADFHCDQDEGRMADNVDAETPGGTPAVAIVGAGPSGLFAAQHLRRLAPSARIDVLDRLPVPYGLIRYGVAPDHQGTKAVARQFERLFERDGVAFFGNVKTGRDVDLTELSELYDAVVLATGLCGDKKLGIPGDGKAGVWGSGLVTRWFNSHPDSGLRCPNFGSKAVIIGNGNVALDVARLLCKQSSELSGSDLHPSRISELEAQRIDEVTIVGRGGPHCARFDVAMIKELASLSDIHVTVDWPGRLPAGLRPEQSARVDALRMLQQAKTARARRTLRFLFNLTPTVIAGEERVAAIDFRSASGGDPIRIEAASVVTAIGFEADAHTPLRRPDSPTGPPPRELADRLYATGWFHLGANGTIADNRIDARAAVEAVASRIHCQGRAGRAGLSRLLESRGTMVVDYSGWLRIREHENNAGNGVVPRIKTCDFDALIAQAAPPMMGGWR